MSNEGVREQVITDFFRGRSSAATLQCELASWINAVTEIPVIGCTCGDPPFVVAIADFIKAINAVETGDMTPEALACLAGILIASDRFASSPDPERRLLAALFHISNEGPPISPLIGWRRYLMAV